jgi:hypothetical protein
LGAKTFNYTVTQTVYVAHRIMKSNLRLPLAAAAALLALTGCNQSPESAAVDETKLTGKPSDPPVQLKAAWKPGWNYQFFVQSQQNADLGFGGGRGRGGGGGGGGGGTDSGLEMTYKQDLSVTVTNGPDDGVNLDMELESLGVTAFMGSETVMHYDSAQQTASGQAEQLAPMLDSMVGGHFTCVMDGQGKLKTVEGIRELIEKNTDAGAKDAAGGDPAARRGGGRRGGMGMLGGMMGTGMLQRMLSDVYFRPVVEFPGLPEGPVRIGQSWTNQQESTVMGLASIVLLTTNTFTGWQMRDGHKCARIEVTGTILQAKQRGGGDTMNILRFLGDLSFDDAVINGTIWLDPQLQFPVEVAMSQSFNIAGTLPVGMGGMGGRRPGGNNDPAAAGAAATPAGERFSRPVSMGLLLKLRSATGP